MKWQKIEILKYKLPKSVLQYLSKCTELHYFAAPAVGSQNHSAVSRLLCPRHVSLQ